MKRLKALFLALLMAAALFSGCSAGKDTEGPGSAGAPQTSQEGDKEPAAPSGQEEPAAPEELTMEDAQVRLVYAESGYVMLAFHGPDHDTGMHLCQKDGSKLHGENSVGYWHPSPGWMLAVSFKVDEEYTIEDIGLSVTDYSAEKTAEGRYPETLFTDFGEPMTDEELKAIGIDIVDGHSCVITDDNRLSYGADNVQLYIYFEGIGDDKDFKVGESGLTSENFQFFTGDGTPLGEAFEGYQLEVEVGGTFGNSVSVVLRDTSEQNKSKNKALCDELRAREPYMVFTGTDGSAIQVPLLQG